MDFKIHKNHVFLINFWKFRKKNRIFKPKNRCSKVFGNHLIMILNGLGDASRPRTHSDTIGDPSHLILTKKNIFDFFEFFFGLKSYGFWDSRAFPGPQVNKNFIFSKSKPLNENRIDRFLIYVPLDLPLAWFGLNTHSKKAYWIWKLVKISSFWVKYVKIQKSNLKLQKSQIFKMDKIFK